MDRQASKSVHKFVAQKKESALLIRKQSYILPTDKGRRISFDQRSGNAKSTYNPSAKVSLL